MIVERPQEGKAISKQRPDFWGSRSQKKFSEAQIELALQLFEACSHNQAEEKTGLSKSTLIRVRCKEAAAE